MVACAPYTHDHLALAELHLVEAADRLAHLEEIAARLPRGSAHAAMAGDLLATMQQTLALMAAHRALILRELEGDDTPRRDPRRAAGTRRGAIGGPTVVAP